MSDWRLQAACRGMGPDLFFPEDGAAPDDALAVCGRCEVVAECRVASVGQMGVWGGDHLTQRGIRRRRCVGCRAWFRPSGDEVRCANCRRVNRMKASAAKAWDRNRACLWQGCRRPFYAHYNYQLYCSAACRGRASEASRRVS